MTKPAEFPDAALDLLTQSTRDSCAICAEKNREKAFAELGAFYSPGTLIASNQDRHFVRLDGGTQELVLSSYTRATPRLTLRFHTGAEHLVGVDPSNYTDDESTATYVAATAQTRLQGMIQVIDYPYGDGPGYLYFPSENHLQVQCRIVELTPD